MCVCVRVCVAANMLEYISERMAHKTSDRLADKTLESMAAWLAAKMPEYMQAGMLNKMANKVPAYSILLKSLPSALAEPSGWRWREYTCQIECQLVGGHSKKTI